MANDLYEFYTKCNAFRTQIRVAEGLALKKSSKNTHFGGKKSKTSVIWKNIFYVLASFMMFWVKFLVQGYFKVLFSMVGHPGSSQGGNRIQFLLGRFGGDISVSEGTSSFSSF